MNRIREIAFEKNIRISQIVKETGLSKTFIYAVINGKSNPTINTALKIAKVLNSTVGELFIEEIEQGS